MLKRVLGAALAAAAIALIPLAGHAAGLWDNWPGVGQPSFCSTYATTTSGQSCVQTIPAGPSTFTGFEYAPFDLNQAGTAGIQAGGAASATVNILQLGNGPMLDVTSPATATIPNNTAFYFLDGAQGSAFTITMPSAPIEGQIQRIVCTAATVGNLTIAANTNQSIKNAPTPAACVAGVGYAWRYQASNTTWYRFQ